ncbi:metal ABC transporter permease [Caldalkalibacillus thermarum TA2.A1]|uniref:Metal ABC transporter permease n=1 Tax=Caldalkalibacillus thermarum (strain TA2.A1) TaxID=986075 RepID=A0A8X8IC98_CALTT|nr:metal ABC transporter permease [Caldalkalibacillus thermarum]QZT35084.1 metal ABC transporter permease [Caldalkalibacillus thermarum TA2.A1]
MIDVLIHFEFMRHALISGIIIGFLAPLLGVFLVVRRLSMIADALSHVSLTGIAFNLLLAKYFSFFAALNPVYMGMGFAVAGALIIERLRKSYRFYQELPIPIILSTGIGLGVVFISIANGFNVDLFNYLFGSIIAITRTDRNTIMVIGAVVLLVVTLLYKELFSLSFDDEHARITGIPRRWINLVFTILVALVIASAMRIVGILLVSALMVLPVAASIQLANSFKQTFLYAILFGELSVILGLYCSYTFNWAPGGTIVVIAFMILITVLGIKKWVIQTD